MDQPDSDLDDLLPNDLPRPKLPPTIGERLRELWDGRKAAAGETRRPRLSFDQQPVLLTTLAAVVAGTTVVIAALTWSTWQDRSSPPVDELLPVLGAGPLADPVADPAASPAPVTTQNAPAPMQAVDAEDRTNSVAGQSVTDVGEREIAVHVAGAVRNPGVVYLSSTERVVDAIEAGGGATDIADLNRLNLALPLVDGEQIYVPTVGEEAPTQWPTRVDPSATPTAVAPEPIDINRASELELQELPGIGPTMAAAIVGYRESVGGFVSVDELVNVSGIGPARLETLRPLVVARETTGS